ncbi:butyrophilin subfamily 1 member A1-like [Chanos chanos]|uniref:Butyrophilin subfamily 1 member A1-like n=1 Tax=Chanos chanos TaxID=29144 RepID=A0A6J2VSP2_CHACN|nr:butyrophilin subfamily 1 member A1-like [Chanos chanos]
MRCFCVPLLMLLWSPVSTIEKFQVVGSTKHLIVLSGEDVILPCHLRPNISAVDMDVEWSLEDKNDLVYVYSKGIDRPDQQSESYKGRSSLFKDELENGNVSLKLSRVQFTDDGVYSCAVRSSTWYHDTTFKVSVEAWGTRPAITMEQYSVNGGLSLLCETEGWRPDPEISWLNSQGMSLPAEYTKSIRETNGFSLKRRITVKEGNTFYCRVAVRNHTKQAEITISTWDRRRRKSNFWIPLFYFSYCFCLFFCFSESARKQSEEEFERKRRTHHVDVTLDRDTAHRFLDVSDDGKVLKFSDSEQVRNGEEFNYVHCVLAKEGYSTQRFYYEVQVTGKISWSLGVAKESITRKGPLQLRPQNGFWTLWLKDGNQYEVLTDPPFSSPAHGVRKVGVFVDCVEGEVSFYDVEAKSLIHSLTDQPLTDKKLYPILSPHVNSEGRNAAPMIITPISMPA